MRRLLLNLLTLLSLLLCIAALGLWALGLSAGPNVANLPVTWSTTRSDHWAIVTAPHQVAVHHVHEDPTAFSPAGATPEAAAAWTQQFDQGSRRELLGFLRERRLNLGQIKNGRTYYAGWETWTAVPYASLLLATAPLPVLRAVRYRRRRQRRRAAEGNRCPTCGYDLRASTGRCPECGTTIGDPSLAGGLARRSAAQDPT